MNNGQDLAAVSAAANRIKLNQLDQICDQIRRGDFTNDLDDEYWRSACGTMANQDGNPLTVVQSPFNPYMGADDNPSIDPPSGNPDMAPPPLTWNVHNYPDPIFETHVPVPNKSNSRSNPRPTMDNDPRFPHQDTPLQQQQQQQQQYDSYNQYDAYDPYSTTASPNLPPGQDPKNVIRTIDPRQSALRQNLPYGSGDDLEGTALGIAPRFGGISPPIPGLFTNPGIHPYNIQQTEQSHFASDSNDVFFHRQTTLNRNPNLRSHDWSDTLTPINPDIYVMSPIAAGALNTTVTKMRGPAAEFVPENQTLMYDTRRSIGVIVNPYTQEVSQAFVEDIPPPDTDKNYIMEERFEEINPRLVGLMGYNPQNPRQSKREVCQDMPGPDHGRNPWGHQMYNDQIQRRTMEIWSSQLFNNRNEIAACESQLDRYPNNYLGHVPIIRPPAYLPPTQRGNDAGMGGAAEYVQSANNQFLQNRNSVFDLTPQIFQRKCKAINDLWERNTGVAVHPDLISGPILPRTASEKQTERSSYAENKNIGSVEGQISLGTADLSRAALQRPNQRTDSEIRNVPGAVSVDVAARIHQAIINDIVIPESKERETNASYSSVQGHAPGTVGAALTTGTLDERSDFSMRGGGDASNSVNPGIATRTQHIGQQVRAETTSRTIPQREGVHAQPGSALSTEMGYGLGTGMDRSTISNIVTNEDMRPVRPDVGRSINLPGSLKSMTVRGETNDTVETQREMIGDVGHALSSGLYPHGGRNTILATSEEETLRRPMEVRGLQGRRVMAEVTGINVDKSTMTERNRRIGKDIGENRSVGMVEGQGWNGGRATDPLNDLSEQGQEHYMDRMIASIETPAVYSRTDRSQMFGERASYLNKAVENNESMAHVLGVHSVDRFTGQASAHQQRNNQRADTGPMRDVYGAVGTHTTQSTANETPSDARVPQRADTGINRQTMAAVVHPTNLGRTVDPSESHVEPARITNNLPPIPQRVPHGTIGSRLGVGKVSDRIFRGKLPGTCRAAPSTLVKNGFTSLGIQERTIPWSLVDECNKDLVGWPTQRF